MRIHTSYIAAALILAGLMGNAQAQDATTQSTSVPLGVAIAMQGNQALVDIRSTLGESIPQSVESLMATSLPAAPVAHNTDAEPGKERATYIAALAVAR